MTRTKKLNDSDALRIALQVIVTKGPSSFTLMDISKKTKLAPATLIQRFKTKDNLLFKALERDHADFSIAIQKNLPKWEAQGVEGIIAFLSSLSEGIDGESLGEHVQLLAKDLSVPKLHRMAQERMELVRKTLRKLLEAAEKSGNIKNGLSIDDCVYNIEALWHGSSIQWGFLKQRSMRVWVNDRLSSFMELLKINS